MDLVTVGNHADFYELVFDPGLFLFVLGEFSVYFVEFFFEGLYLFFCIFELDPHTGVLDSNFGDLVYGLVLVNPRSGKLPPAAHIYPLLLIVCIIFMGIY